MHRACLDTLVRRSLLRRLQTIDSATGAEVELEGHTITLLSSNNYLDLATHPRVLEAAIAAIRRYGVGAGASRLIAGTQRPHTELEECLAAFKGTEAALVFSTGYQTNLGLIQVLAEDRDVVLADRLCHASLIDACRLCNARLRIYRHRDAGQVAHVLGKERRGVGLIVTDGVFSMDGDLAPLPELQRTAQQTGSLLMVDDAHGTGVMGPTGRGTLEHFQLDGAEVVQMGTLSKALGSFGGFVVGPHDLIEYLINRARAFIYTTALPPALAAAATAALRVAQQEPERRTRLWQLRQQLFDGLRGLGFEIGQSHSPIIPLITGEADTALRVAEHLLAHSFYAPAIRPPTVPQGQSRIRLSVTCGHTSTHIDRILETLALLRTTDKELWDRLTIPGVAARERRRGNRLPTL